MKVFPVLVLVVMTICMSSCATVLGGKVTDCQRTRPSSEEPSREVRVGALIADIILFLPAVIVDFATGAIYRPCDKK